LARGTFFLLGFLCSFAGLFAVRKPQGMVFLWERPPTIFLSDFGPLLDPPQFLSAAFFGCRDLFSCKEYVTFILFFRLRGGDIPNARARVCLSAPFFFTSPSVFQTPPSVFPSSVLFRLSKQRPGAPLFCWFFIARSGLKTNWSSLPPMCFVLGPPSLHLCPRRRRRLLSRSPSTVRLPTF